MAHMKQKITPFWTLLEHFSHFLPFLVLFFLCVTYEWRFWHAHVTHMRTFVCSRIRMAIPNWLTWTRRMGCWCEASLLVDCCQRQSRGTFPHCQPCSLLSHRSWFSLHSPWWSRKYNMHTMTHEIIRHKYSLKCEEITFYDGTLRHLPPLHRFLVCFSFACSSCCWTVYTFARHWTLPRSSSSFH